MTDGLREIEPETFYFSGAVKNMLRRAGGIAATRIYAAEAAKSDLPQITKNQVENAGNRSVSLYLVPLERNPAEQGATE